MTDNNENKTDSFARPLEIGEIIPRDLYVIAIMGGYWARGNSLADAIRNIKEFDRRLRISAKSVSDYANGKVDVLFYVTTDPEAYVNNFGSVCWDRGHFLACLGSGNNERAGIRGLGEFAVAAPVIK